MTSTNKVFGLLESPQIQRWKKASAVKKLKTISDFPRLEVWNYDACEEHEVPTPTCSSRKCGGELYMHQKKTAVYSYMGKHTIVASSTGTGKSPSALATLALVHHYGEEVRCVAIVPSTAVLQWEAEIKRWTPGFTVEKIPPKTHKKVRLETYAKPWNILVIGYHAFSKDFANVVKCGAKQSIVDDVDPILDHRNATHNAIVSLTRTCDLNIVMNATISSMRAEQVYSATNLIGGSSIWGSMTNFTRNYIKKDKVWVTNRKGEKVRTFQTVGYKNLKDMMSKLRPMLIRYSYEDIADDLNIPDVVPQEVMLEMSPAQKRKMQELQSGVRTVLNNKGMPTAQKSINALTLYAYANQITSGIFALKTSDGGFEPDSAQASPKADWLMNKLTGEWKNEKVIVYVKYKGSHLALSERFKKAGIGYSIISGAITDPQERQAEIDRFWNDPDTKVILISRSGERSLNLQNARITVVYDQIVNPGVFTQVAGRSRRVGSNHGSVFLISLIMEDTHEERIPLALASRQAFQDYVYDEAQDPDDNGTYLFQKLTPDQLLKLLAP